MAAVSGFRARGRPRSLFQTVLNAADLRDLNAWIRQHHEAEWAALHGDDEAIEETGFHLVQNDGAKSRLFGGYNAVDTVADGRYHLGFGHSRRAPR